LQLDQRGVGLRAHQQARHCAGAFQAARPPPIVAGRMTDR
jgi:hypothetical protein